MKLTTNIDKFGTAGLFLTALLSPCCFPLFAFTASVFGLGSFELFGGWTMWVFQAMVLLTISGLIVSYFRHRCTYPLLLAVPSGILIFYGYYFNNSDYWTYFLYAGMFGLLAASFWNYRRNKLHAPCNTRSTSTSTLTCPECGHQKTETMPTDACVYFYECEHCKTRLKPRPGDCCVYCSYGTVKCPSKQNGETCC